MAIVDLLMPKMGESIMEATILKWNKQPGESIQQDESLLDIATDKVDSEVPSTAAGDPERNSLSRKCGCSCGCRHCKNRNRSE